MVREVFEELFYGDAEALGRVFLVEEFVKKV